MKPADVIRAKRICDRSRFANRTDGHISLWIQ
jgi:hypothetical protein